MSKILIVANWKMEPQSEVEAKKLFSAIKSTVSRLRHTSTIICPPFLYLSLFTRTLFGKNLALGAQDVFWEFEGAHTGEISPDMLRNMGVEYSIVGHSERRTLGETDEIIAQKIKAALAGRICPILCIGERERDKDGRYLAFLKEEIKNSLAKATKKNIKNIIIAYEPIWAIGVHAKGADTPEGTLEIVIFIKKVLADMFGKNNVMNIPILYGGSVNSLNAFDFLSRGGVDGLLVGRASINAPSFKTILQLADSL